MHSIVRPPAALLRGPFLNASAPAPGPALRGAPPPSAAAAAAGPASRVRVVLRAASAEGLFAELFAAAAGPTVLYGPGASTPARRRRGRLTTACRARPGRSPLAAWTTATFGRRRVAVAAVTPSRQTLLLLAALPFLPVSAPAARALLLARHGAGPAALRGRREQRVERVDGRSSSPRGLRGRYSAGAPRRAPWVERLQGSAWRGCSTPPATAGRHRWRSAASPSPRPSAARSRPRPCCASTSRPRRPPRRFARDRGPVVARSRRARRAHLPGWRGTRPSGSPAGTSRSTSSTTRAPASRSSRRTPRRRGRARAVGAALGARARSRRGTPGAGRPLAPAAAGLPLLWLATSPGALGPIAVDAAIGGVAWGGHALATFALPLEIGARRDRPFQLAAFSMAGGVSYAAAAARGHRGGSAAAGGRRARPGRRSRPRAPVVVSAAGRLASVMLALRTDSRGAVSLAEVQRAGERRGRVARSRTCGSGGGEAGGPFGRGPPPGGEEGRRDGVPSERVQPEPLHRHHVLGASHDAVSSRTASSCVPPRTTIHGPCASASST